MTDPTPTPENPTATDVEPEADGRVAAWKLLAGNPVTLFSVIVLVIILVVALLAPWLAPYGVNQTDVTRALQSPSAEHWMGTDDLGRDIFSRIIVASGTSLQIALVSVIFAFVIGVPIGIISGYLGGITDTVLMRCVDVMFAFPVLLLALAIVAILSPGQLTTMIAIGVVFTPIFARVARASTLSVRVEPFVQVSKTMGTPGWWILLRHILPNITGPVVVQTSLSLAFAILSEAALSFLGLGIQPPNPSWGGMLFDAQGFMSQAWWMSVFPGAAIFVTVLAFNLLGDGLRDVLDPKQRTLAEARRKA
ncbi:ABC transporter permease [Nesterenkonia muleiensis]|uniref:ABC transporter permease n=1 Tax=Nesterenkonia muleiensis TaxID=2282648 RepID=UPI000E70ABF7|nr:ABC transporter permease [Nesterenkonia muleiensis]